MSPDDRPADTTDPGTTTTPGDFASRFFADEAPQFSVTVGAASHRGLVREQNEDHFAVIQRCRSRRVLITNLPLSDLESADEVSYGMVVADGVGGAVFGELASRLAIRTFGEMSARATSWLMRLKDADAQQVRERIEAYARAIQQAFVDEARRNPETKGMGTTWTSATLLGPDAIIAHVGDSRAYRFRDGAIEQITRDHTLAQLLKEQGSPEAELPVYRRTLLNYFGGGDSENVPVEMHDIDLQGGDRLLLCTDGLTDLCNDDDLAAVLSTRSAPQAACDELVAMALARGGKDNVTVIVAAIHKNGNEDTVPGDTFLSGETLLKRPTRA